MSTKGIIAATMVFSGMGAFWSCLLSLYLPAAFLVAIALILFELLVQDHFI